MNLADAFEIVLELARQNVADAADMPDEHPTDPRSKISPSISLETRSWGATTSEPAAVKISLVAARARRYARALTPTANSRSNAEISAAENIPRTHTHRIL